jgi:hypothetical protein
LGDVLPEDVVEPPAADPWLLSVLEAVLEPVAEDVVLAVEGGVAAGAPVSITWMLLYKFEISP